MGRGHKATTKDLHGFNNFIRLSRPHRNTSHTDSVGNQRDFPAVTRTRSGYVNPLRMNPPTHRGSPARGSINKVSCPPVVGEDKHPSHRKLSASCEVDLDISSFNKDIAEQLNSAFQICGEDNAPQLCPITELSNHEPDTEAQDPGRTGTHPRGSWPAGNTIHVASQGPATVTEARVIGTSKAEVKTSADAQYNAGDENLKKTTRAQNGKIQVAAEAESTAVGRDVSGSRESVKIPSPYSDATPGFRQGSMYLDLGSQSNFHRTAKTTGQNNDTAARPASDDAWATLQDGSDEKRRSLRSNPQPSVAKILKDGANVLFSKAKRDDNDSKCKGDAPAPEDPQIRSPREQENSLAFADLSQGNPLEYRIELARRYTNMYVELLSPTDTNSPRRPDDSRVWYSRNLRCIFCQGHCPICEVECCVYRAAKEVLAKPKNFQTEICTRLVEIIESLGARVKDVSTFAMCTPNTGCGRRVCPNCCGACPNTICRDIQCKQCKPDPWAECDWH